MKTVLLHCCCAPCSLSCVAPLRAEGIEPVAFWYNPNIHPWKEYQARRDCLLEYAPAIGMETRVREDYGLREFVRRVAEDSGALETLLEDVPGDGGFTPEVIRDIMTTAVAAPQFERYDQAMIMAESAAADAAGTQTQQSRLLAAQREINVFLNQ